MPSSELLASGISATLYDIPFSISSDVAFRCQPQHLLVVIANGSNSDGKLDDDCDFAVALAL